MPIDGMTDRGSLQPRYPILGKLRKGGKKKPDGSVGDDLPYFRFVPRKGYPEVGEAFTAIYGPEPASIWGVRFPLPLMEDVFPTWREAYTQSRLLRLRCNGREWVYWIEGHMVRRGRRPCALEHFDPDNRCPNCPCHPVGRLSIYLEPLWKKGFIGLITVETHGINDLTTIGGTLITHEPLTGKEFRLYRQPQTVGAPVEKQKKRIAVEKHMVRIELSRDWALLEMGKQEQEARAILVAHTDPGEAVYRMAPSEPPTDAQFYEDDLDFEEPPDGVFVGEPPPPPPQEAGEPPPPEDPAPAAPPSSRARQPRSQAAPTPPPSPDGDARLDRENQPQAGDGWTTFYTWAMGGGYSREAAFVAIKRAHPGITRRKMCSVMEAVGALLDDEKYRISGGQNGDKEGEGHE